MCVTLATLFAEILLYIAEYLRAPLECPLDVVTVNYATVPGFDRRDTSYVDVRNFASTCSTIRKVCLTMLFKGVNLDGRQRRQTFLESKHNNTLSNFLLDGKKVR